MKASDREDAWLVLKILAEPTPAVDFLLKSGNFGVGQHCTSQRLSQFLLVLLLQ
jgi:hypothetical protein